LRWSYCPQGWCDLAVHGAERPLGDCCMIVAPGFVDHWKTRRLIRLRLNHHDNALEIILRLWSFCQENKRWRFCSLTDQDLDDICRAFNVKADLMSAGFLKEERGVLVVHDWQHFNGQLISSWKNGVKGGRPSKTHGIPTGNPRGTHGEPSHLIYSNLSNQSVLTNSTNSTNTSTKAKPGSIEEVVQYCIEIGLKPDDGKYMYHHWESNGYTNKGRAVRSWKNEIQSWRLANHFPSQKKTLAKPEQKWITKEYPAKISP